MPHGLDQILPSIQALGLVGYWAIGAASLLEAFFLTGVIVPGTLVVDAGGILAQRGVLDFFDLAWFVAIGSVLGAEGSFWAGRAARSKLSGRWQLEQSRAYVRAEALFARHGGWALVIGRFLGPVSGLVPLVAALAGMERRKFLLWSVLASIPYALAHLSLGYFLGDMLGRLGPMATRLAVAAGVVVAGLAVLWWLLYRLSRLLPPVLTFADALLAAFVARPVIVRWRMAHPVAARRIAARFDRSHFFGLPLSVLGLVFLYVFAVWLDSVFEFVLAAPILQVDPRLAELIHRVWSPPLLRVAAHVTALGDWRVVLPVMAAALLWLWSLRRGDLMIGLGVAVAGDVISVAILKRIFDRPRPQLAYFVEHSGSFPSGHAAISVALYGTLAYALWRTRRLGPLAAAFAAAVVAFALGVSRLYLIEHYLSDVLNGWLVGGLWLVLAITVIEWRRAQRQGPPVAPPARMQRTLVYAGLLALCVVAGWQVAGYDKARAIPPASLADRHIADIRALPDVAGVPPMTESLLGTPLAPVNVVIVARDDAALRAALVQAGWQPARAPSLAALIKAAYAALTGAPDPAAPIAPAFWRAEPNDMAFERRPAASAPATRTPVLRVWRTHVATPAGRVFLGTANADHEARIGTPEDARAVERLLADLGGKGGAVRAPALHLRGGSAVAVIRLPDRVDGNLGKL